MQAHLTMPSSVVIQSKQQPRRVMSSLSFAGTFVYVIPKVHLILVRYRWLKGENGLTK